MIERALNEQQIFGGLRLADPNPPASGLAEGSPEPLRAWILERLAGSLHCRPEEIDSQVPFSMLGLDSLQAFNLTGELAQWLQRELPATLLWDFATVEQLVQHLQLSPGAWER